MPEAGGSLATIAVAGRDGDHRGQKKAGEMISPVAPSGFWGGAVRGAVGGLDRGGVVGQSLVVELVGVAGAGCGC
jgi:hypothetical protein